VLLLRFIRGGLTKLPGRARLQCRSSIAAATIGHNDCDYEGHAVRRTLLVSVGPGQRILASLLFRRDSPVNENRGKSNFFSWVTLFWCANIGFRKKDATIVNQKRKDIVHKRMQNKRVMYSYAHTEEIKDTKYVTHVFNTLNVTHIYIHSARWSHRINFLIPWWGSDGAGICKIIESLVNVDLRMQINQNDIAIRVNIKAWKLQIGKFLWCIYIFIKI